MATEPGASLADSTDRKRQELNDKCALLLPFVAKVDTFSEVIKKVNDIEKAVAHVSDYYDAIPAKLDTQGNDVTALKKRVDRIELGSSPQVRQMRIQLNELEQYRRRHNIQVRGIVEEQHENLLEQMNDLDCKLELPELAQSDLDALHRLPSRPGKEYVVIACFASNRSEGKMDKKALCSEDSRPVNTDNGQPYAHEQAPSVARHKQRDRDELSVCLAEKRSSVGPKVRWR